MTRRRISFAFGTSMPHLPVSRLVDTAVECPHVTGVPNLTYTPAG